MADKLVSQKYPCYIVGVTAVSTAAFLGIYLKKTTISCQFLSSRTFSPWAAILEE
jgi:hypothetical protein